MNRFPLAAVSRLRMMTDGDGITTLVAAMGCPLRCRMCINPGTWNGTVKPVYVSARELYERVRVDGLYFLATGGGITFGGGEPLMHAEFIQEFAELCPDGWRLSAETSLQVPPEKIGIAASCIGHFYVDIKDTNDEIYRQYTGGGNALALENLKRLIKLAGSERVTVRLPLIPGFNTADDVERSAEILSDMGVTMFDRFIYRTK